MEQGKIKVLIVEDEPLFRDMLRSSLGQEPDLQVMGAVADGAEAIRAAKELQPDVVLMDIELGSEPNGILAGHQIKAAFPQTGIVILSVHKDKQFIASLPTQKASGWSYLLKQSVADTESLARAIRGSASGLVVMDPTIVQELRPRDSSRLAGLTERQLEVLMLMAEGYSNAGIAKTLTLAEKSVENYINSILQELGISREQQVHPRVKAVLTYLEQTQTSSGHLGHLQAHLNLG